MALFQPGNKKTGQNPNALLLRDDKQRLTHNNSKTHVFTATGEKCKSSHAISDSPDPIKDTDAAKKGRKKKGVGWGWGRWEEKGVGEKRYSGSCASTAKRLPQILLT